MGDGLKVCSGAEAVAHKVGSYNKSGFGEGESQYVGDGVGAGQAH